MKRLVIYGLFALLTFMMMVSCHSGGDASEVAMEVNRSYEILSDASIMPDEPSEIIIDHVFGSEVKSVKLLSGSATLLREPYLTFN